MSSILEVEVDRTKMSPLDDIKSPTSVESELIVADMLDEHEQRQHLHHHHHQLQQQHHQTQQQIGIKRKREDDVNGVDELVTRKLPTLAGNNNDVSFVLEEQPTTEDTMHDDNDDVSLLVHICVFPRDPVLIDDFSCILALDR